MPAGPTDTLWHRATVAFKKVILPGDAQHWSHMTAVLQASKHNALHGASAAGISQCCLQGGCAKHPCQTPTQNQLRFPCPGAIYLVADGPVTWWQILSRQAPIAAGRIQAYVRAYVQAKHRAVAA